MKDRFGDPIVMLLRAHVIEALAGRLDDGTLADGMLSLSSEVTSVSADGTVTVISGDGSSGKPDEPGSSGGPGGPGVSLRGGSLSADLVVAADGIRSAARAALFPAHPGLKYSGFTTWRLVTPALPGPAPEMSETWGRGTVFGVMPMAGGRVYCYAAAPAPAQDVVPSSPSAQLAPPAPPAPPGLSVPLGPSTSSGTDHLAELTEMFGGWHEPVPSLLRSVSPADVLRLDVSELAAPLPSFHVGRVAFLGDAAHPMTPNLGQGACQALEDAVTLSRLATGASAADVPELLSRYSALRMPRAHMIVKRSRQAGTMATWTSPVAVGVRNTLVTAIGKIAPSAALAGVAPVFTWQPPPPGLQPGLQPGR